VRRIKSQLRYRLLITGAWLLCRIPERPLMAVADLFGGVWYRLARGRRRTARDNLAHVTRWMAEHDVGSERGRAAGRDPRALEALVKAAFRHSVRYNLILARGPIMDAKYVARWLVVETPEVMDSALAEPNGALFVGLHMGSNELPALYLAQKTGRPAWAPTQTLDDPLLQAYMVRSRATLGLHLVELQSARRELAEATPSGSLRTATSRAAGSRFRCSGRTPRCRSAGRCWRSKPERCPTSTGSGATTRASTGCAWSGCPCRPRAAAANG
jgi:lauroyl/myristoyl acyltransferase